MARRGRICGSASNGDPHQYGRKALSDWQETGGVTIGRRTKNLPRSTIPQFIQAFIAQTGWDGTRTLNSHSGHFPLKLYSNCTKPLALPPLVGAASFAATTTAPSAMQPAGQDPETRLASGTVTVPALFAHECCGGEVRAA